MESDSDKQAPDDFNSLVEILNDHFVVRPNKRFMRHVLGDSLKIHARQSLTLFAGR